MNNLNAVYRFSYTNFMKAIKGNVKTNTFSFDIICIEFSNKIDAGCKKLGKS